MKSILSRVIALMVLLSMVVAPVSAQSTPPTGPRVPIADRSTLSSLEPVDKFSQGVLEAVSEGVVINEVAGNNEPARYIVVLPAKPLATYQGGIGGLSATAPSITGEKLDVTSPESQTYLEYLKGQQEAYLTVARNVLGFAPKVLFQYRYATNGFSMMLTPAEAELLAAQTGARVYRAPIETPDTDEGPTLIGAPAIWDGETASGVATQGEGVLVGIIDTGINFDHPSFSATPDDEFVYDWAGDYLGVCGPAGDPAYAAACNDKLVGAFTYVATEPDEIISPEDSEGHGSHTASTVAGNFVDVDFYGVGTTISGVAPHAQIIAFDVCVPTPPNGACFGDATMAAVDDAIFYGVDVINYSISGGSSPYTDPVELAFLAANEAGIFVSTSAGNAGDTTGASSVAHRSPWVSTVAASTHARIFANALDITGPGTVPPELVGLGAVQSGTPVSADIVNLPIKYSPTNLNGCAAFPADYFTGSFALIARGTCTFTVKETNARNAGAEYVFIYNSRTGPPVGMSGVVSAAMLSLEEGLAVKGWIDANPTAASTATMHAGTSRILNPAWEDIIAAFSSYGPNTTFDVLKPDITGPGVNILAAVADGTIAASPDYELDQYQGTSMSSPHNAGAAALVMALHPDWTPMQVRSAMMMTAQDGLLADRSAWDEGVRPATPQDEGSGRIALQNTALVGLVMDETIANFEAADPALGGNPASLNLASLYSSKCVGVCTWTRTVKSVLQTAADYTVTAPAWVTVIPSTFTIAAGGTQVLTFIADVSALSTDVWQYGKIVFETTATHPGTTAKLIEEDFETWPLTGWSIASDTASCGDWTSGSVAGEPNNTGGTGDFADANSDYCGDAMDTWMVTPSFDLTGVNTAVLTFKSEFNDYYNSDDGYVDVSTDAGTAWTNLLHYAKADYWGPRTETIDLATYIGQADVQIRFHYVAPDWDWYWQVDDVVVTVTGGVGPEVSGAHIPLAVLPTASNIPTLVKYDSHRDADGAIIEDLAAVEITEGTTYLSGLTKASLETFTLDPDPTNGDPIDDLSQVFVKKLDVPAYTIRLVGEITASTSLDLDMFLYWDEDGDGALSSADYLVASSATGAVLEYLNAPKGFVYYNLPDTYFLVVQNWSGTPGDTVTLATGLVPYSPEAGNYQVSIPPTNPAGEPFSMEITWNEDTEDGDRLYGYFDTCADATCETWIGTTDIDVRRGADDVVKTVDKEFADEGEVVTYTIAISNFTNQAQQYAFTDVIPVGVTYVPDSETAGAVYDPATNTISWSGDVPASYYNYAMSTSLENLACSMPLANSGAYVNLKAYGLSPSASITGEGTWGWATTGDPINFYGQNVGNLLLFTDDAYAYFGDFVPALPTNADMPLATPPNNLTAYLWKDLVINYDLATTKGVTRANLTTEGIPSGHIIEMDDVNVKGNPAQTYDIEMFISKAVDEAPGEFEVVFAYDNINGPLTTGTVGVENATGTTAVKFAYNNAALATLTNGMAICFDWALLPAPPTEVSFQVTVGSEENKITNFAMHDNTMFGTLIEGAQASFIANVVPPVVDDQTIETLEETPVSITLTASETNPGPVTWTILTQPANGVLSGTAPDLVYSPNLDFYGMDSFAFLVNDGLVDSEPGTITINVTNINDAPMAVDDFYWTDFETVLNVSALEGVLANDNDPDPTDNIILELVQTTANGLLVLNQDGSFDYTPNAGYRGIDTFVYRFFGMPTIQSEWFDEATVYITVNDVPVALDQSLETAEDTPLAVTLTGDFLLPGDVVWTIVTQPEHGTLSGVGPDLVYTPELNWYGSDAFTFTVNDGLQDSNVATVSITVQPINDAPSAVDDYYVTTLDTQLDIPAPGVLANDVELDPTDILYADLFEGPQHGTVVLNQDGSFTYTPNAGFYGADSFSYLMLGIPAGNSILGEYQDDAVVHITVLPAVTIYLPLLFK